MWEEIQWLCQQSTSLEEIKGKATILAPIANLKDFFMQNCQFFLARSGQLEKAKYLYSLGAQLWSDIHDQTPFHILARHTDNSNYAAWLTTEKPEIKHDADKNGLLPIHYAAEAGNINIVRYLVEQDKSLATKKDNFGRTPLMMACMNGGKSTQRFAVLDCLIKAGADSSNIDNDGLSCLDYAAHFFSEPSLIAESEKIFDKQLPKTIASNISNISNIARLTDACRQYAVGDFSHLKIANSISLNADFNGYSFLHWFCYYLPENEARCRDLKIIASQHFFEDVAACSHNNILPLHIALALGKFRFAQIFMHQMIHLDYQDEFERTFLHAACSCLDISNKRVDAILFNQTLNQLEKKCTNFSNLDINQKDGPIYAKQYFGEKNYRFETVATKLRQHRNEKMAREDACPLPQPGPGMATMQFFQYNQIQAIPPKHDTQSLQKTKITP